MGSIVYLDWVVNMDLYTSFTVFLVLLLLFKVGIFPKCFLYFLRKLLATNTSLPWRVLVLNLNHIVCEIQWVYGITSLIFVNWLLSNLDLSSGYTHSYHVRGLIGLRTYPLSPATLLHFPIFLKCLLKILLRLLPLTSSILHLLATRSNQIVSLLPPWAPKPIIFGDFIIFLSILGSLSTFWRRPSQWGCGGFILARWVWIWAILLEFGWAFGTLGEGRYLGGVITQMRALIVLFEGLCGFVAFFVQDALFDVTVLLLKLLYLPFKHPGNLALAEGVAICGCHTCAGWRNFGMVRSGAHLRVERVHGSGRTSLILIFDVIWLFLVIEIHVSSRLVRNTGYSLKPDSHIDLGRTRIYQGLYRIFYWIDPLRHIKTPLTCSVIPGCLRGRWVHWTEFGVGLQILSEIDGMQGLFELRFIHFTKSFQLVELAEVGWRRVGVWCNSFRNKLARALIIPRQPLGPIRTEPLATPCKHSSTLLLVHCKELAIIYLASTAIITWIQHLFLLNYFGREWRPRVVLSVVGCRARVVCLIIIIWANGYCFLAWRYSVEKSRRFSTFGFLLEVGEVANGLVGTGPDVWTGSCFLHEKGI